MHVKVILFRHFNPETYLDIYVQLASCFMMINRIVIGSKEFASMLAAYVILASAHEVGVFRRSYRQMRSEPTSRL